MRRLFTLTCICAALCLVGCFSTSSKKNVRSLPLKGIERGELGSGTWSAYLKVMSGRERKNFHRISESERKVLFIRREGIDVRYIMQDLLRRGMSKEMVVGLLEDSVESWQFTKEDNRLYGTAYNGVARTHVYCFFGHVMSEYEDEEADELALLTWGSYTDQNLEEERELHSIEAVASHRLARVLSKGMAKNEIISAYGKARENLENYKRAAAARRELDDYVGFHAPSVSDYRAETEWLRAHAHVDFYAILDMKPAYSKREGLVDYWYFVIPYREESDYYVVIEYRFDSNKLDSWYVYHTDFLGYDRFK